MSIIQQHTSASLSDAWRTINIDALTEDSSVNFDTSALHPPQPEIGEAEVKQLAGQVRQLLRGGDPEGALRGCLDMPVYNGTDGAKVRCRRNTVSAWLNADMELGCASANNHRSPTVNQGERDEPAAQEHLLVRGR